MRKSPIHLNSSKQAKLKVSRSKSLNHQDSSFSIKQNSKLNESIHTITVKRSPNKMLDSQTGLKDSQHLRAQTSTTFFSKTVRPQENRSPFRNMNPLADSRNSRSFYEIPKPHGIVIHPEIKKVSHQKQNKKFSPFQNLSQSMSNNSPIKAIQQNERSFIKFVELGKSRSPIKMIHPPIRMTSPPRIVKQVVYKLTPKQIELERKVKILQMRIGELHNEKNLIETKMNEMNIRLQYQNNFLKQKLNKFPSNKNIRPFSNIDGMIKTVSSQEVHENLEMQTKQLRTSCPQKTHTTLLQVIPQPTEKYSKSSDGFFQKSKQMQSIKQQLLETEEMLSKQIEKSLKLLQQLSLKQKENQEMKHQVKVLNEKLLQKDSKYLEFQSENKKLQEKLVSLEQRFKEITVQVLAKNAYISGLQEKIINSVSEQNDNKVPKELYDEMQQNNQILMAAMTSLQKSVNESQNQIEQLTAQKEQLQEQISRLQSELEEKKTRLEQKQEGNEFWKEKVDETEFQIRDSHSKLQTFQMLMEEKNELIEQKQRQLLQKQLLIQNLQGRLQQLQGNTPQSENGCIKPQRNVCVKCGELRRTVIRLNSYLNNCSSQFSRENKAN